MTPQPKGRLGNVVLTGTPINATKQVAAGRVAPRAPGEILRAVPVGELARSPWQPRHALDEERLAELTESVRARGVLEPLLAREVPDSGPADSEQWSIPVSRSFVAPAGAQAAGPTLRLELLAGERRLEAARRAGLATVPVRVLAGLSDAEAREVALVENLARVDLSVWEQALALAALRDARQAEGKPVSVRELAEAAGFSKSLVGRRLQIAERLPAEIMAHVRAAVPTWDKVAENEVALLAAAGEETPEARVAVLTREARRLSAAARRTEAAATTLLTGGIPSSSALPDVSPAPEALTSGPPAYTLRQGKGGRMTLMLRRPPAELAPREAAELAAQLTPLLDALRERAAAPRGHGRRRRS